MAYHISWFHPHHWTLHVATFLIPVVLITYHLLLFDFHKNCFSSQNCCNCYQNRAGDFKISNLVNLYSLHLQIQFQVQKVLIYYSTVQNVGNIPNFMNILILKKDLVSFTKIMKIFIRLEIFPIFCTV